MLQVLDSIVLFRQHKEEVEELQRRCSEWEVLHVEEAMFEDRIQVLELELETEKEQKKEE